MTSILTSALHHPLGQSSLVLATALLSWSLVEAPVGTDTNQEGAAARSAPPVEEETKWRPLFNGKDLTGWTPKFAGHTINENYLNTFRVEDGLLRVVYDDYKEFGGKFGHLFFEEPFSHYDLRVVYRFREGQVPGGPGWAFRNNGVMVHGQSAASMAVDQKFPASIEAQLLGQRTGAGERSNGNLCTPGTNVEVKGEVKLDHCIGSGGPTSYGGGWVTFELQVRGNEVIRHFVDGKKVMEYQRPQLDPRDNDAKKLIENGADIQLSSGTISLQAESHPIDFKSIEIRVVEPEED